MQPKLIKPQSIESSLLAKLRSAGFREAKPEGLDSPAFPDTFAPSAFHQLVRKSAFSRPTQKEHWCGSDLVFRHVDLPKIGLSPMHLSAFKMIVFFETMQAHELVSRQRSIIQNCISFIRDTLELPPKRLFVTIFGGHPRVPNSVQPTTEIADSWAAAGVPRDHLIPIPGVANLTNIVRVNEPAGPRSEVFVEDIPGRFVEIATLVCECLSVSSLRPLMFQPLESVVCGAAFGVERCDAISQRRENIFQLPSIFPAVKMLGGELDPNLVTICDTQIKVIVDGVRSALLLMNNIQSPLNRARKERIRDLRVGISRAGSALGYGNLQELVERVAFILEESHGFSATRFSHRLQDFLWGI